MNPDTPTLSRTPAGSSVAAPQARSTDAALLSAGRRILTAESAAIQDAARRLDASFAGAVRAILDCRGRVCVTGMGKAGLVGNKIQATLASTGTLSFSLHPVEALHGDLGMVHGDDVILALSKSGSSELVELLPRLRALGCRVILLTARPDSAAAKLADFVLDIGRTEEACPLRLAPSSSTAAMLAMGDALALTVMEVKAVQPEQYASYHPGGALGRFLMKAGEIMRTGQDCPTVGAETTLAECHETILRAPHRAGAACVVDDRRLLLGIITHGDFFRLFKERDYAADRPVSEKMTRNPKRLSADARVVEGLALMRRHAIDELPVVDDDGRLLGLIDIQDLLARGFSEFDPS
ncbi:MAG: KpsF/GutQ family sugar-phosphate isomerase [Phycisphaerae bacterium]|nr:KpsF/GutQ family sugar-phosphate isomerase [Phycisphaerae bacterium]